MLRKIPEHILECLGRAAEARGRADDATDPILKSDYLEMELRWMRLAESYRFVEQANQFLDDAEHHRFPRPSVLKFDNSHSTVTVCEKCGGEAPLIDCAPCTLSRGVRDIWTFKCEVCREDLKRIVER